MPCPHCDQNLCPVCFPPTQHEPCRSSLSSPLKLILLNAIETSSQYPFHFDNCGKSTGKVRQTTIKELDDSMGRACRRNGVAKRGTFPRIVVRVPAAVAAVVEMTGAITVSHYPKMLTQIGWKTSLPVLLNASWSVRTLDSSLICLPIQTDR